MNLPRLYLNGKSLYFQVKHKGVRYSIYPGITLTHRVIWKQQEQKCHVNTDFKFKYGTREHYLVDEDIKTINFQVDKARHEMQENLNYFRKTGDLRFIREVKEGGGERIRTVSQAVERYAKGKHGYRGAKCTFDKYIKTYKGIKSLNIDVNDFYRHLCKNVSNSTAHTVMALVRTALKKVDGRVRDIQMKSVYRQENNILTSDEVVALFKDQELNRKYRDICIVLYYLCLRFSELRHIKYVQGMDKIQLFQPKTGKYKTVNIEGKSELIGALNRLKIVSYTGFTEWLKQKVKDRPYLQRICPDGSILGESIRSHCFRQSSATHAIQAGADIKMVSKHMLNHSDIAVTLRSYYIPNEKDPFDFLKFD